MNLAFGPVDDGDCSEMSSRIDMHRFGGAIAQVLAEWKCMKEGRYPCQLARCGLVGDGRGNSDWRKEQGVGR